MSEAKCGIERTCRRDRERVPAQNQVSADQLTATITAVYDALASLGKPSEPLAALTPAVPVRRSLRADEIVCLECGRSGKTLRRHLAAAHGITPQEYRSR